MKIVLLDSKTIELLRLLDSRTLTRFGEYIHSPYFNKHQILSKFGEYLLKEAPAFKNTSKLQKERVYKNILPDEPYDNKNFHRLNAQLLQLLYNFLADDAWQEKKHERGVLLLEQIRKFSLEKQYQHLKKTHEDLLPKQDLQSSDYYESQYKFYREQDSFFVAKGGRVYDENLQLGNHFLDCFFILEKLKVACDMANRNKVIQADYQWSIMDELAPYLETNMPDFPPIIQIYYTIFKMLRCEDDDAENFYLQLKKLLLTSAPNFNKKDIMETYSYALNYTISQINKKGASYLEEALNLYLYLVECEAIFVDGHLIPQEYKNIVTLGLRLEKYDWTEKFIENFKKKLPFDADNNVYKYNLAFLQYSRGDYQQALQTLHNIDFINPTYYIGTKIMQLKIFYELNESEAFYSLIDACLSYLQRSKTLADYQKKSTTNLMRFSKKLYKIKEEKNILGTTKIKAAVEKLQAELQKAASVANRDWLEHCLNSF